MPRYASLIAVNASQEVIEKINLIAVAKVTDNTTLYCIRAFRGLLARLNENLIAYKGLDFFETETRESSPNEKLLQLVKDGNRQTSILEDLVFLVDWLEKDQLSFEQYKEQQLNEKLILLSKIEEQNNYIKEFLNQATNENETIGQIKLAVADLPEQLYKEIKSIPQDFRGRFKTLTPNIKHMKETCKEITDKITRVNNHFANTESLSHVHDIKVQS